MKFSFKQVVITLIAFMFGILISETITDQLLVIEKVRLTLKNSTFWTALAAIATAYATISAINIAKASRNHNDRVRTADQAERAEEKRDEYTKKHKEIWELNFKEESNRTLITSLYFGSLAKTSTFLTNQDYVAIKADRSNAILIDIRSYWMDALKNPDMSNCLHKINVLNAPDIKLLDEFERHLETSLNVMKVLATDVNKFTQTQEETQHAILEPVRKLQSLLWLIADSAHLISLYAIKKEYQFQEIEVTASQKKDIAEYEARVKNLRAKLKQ